MAHFASSAAAPAAPTAIDGSALSGAGATPPAPAAAAPAAPLAAPRAKPAPLPAILLGTDSAAVGGGAEENSDGSDSDGYELPEIVAEDSD